MPIWLAILLAVGGPLLVGALTTPLVLYVLGRPRVRFAQEPSAYWAHADDKTTLVVVVDFTLINDGSDETRITTVLLELLGSGRTPFNPDLDTKILDWKVERNGGRLEQRVFFKMLDPGDYLYAPHADPIPQFIEASFTTGTLTVVPSQHRRLRWGTEKVTAPLHVIFSKEKVDAALNTR